jgi:hypothetical protein
MDSFTDPRLDVGADLDRTPEDVFELQVETGEVEEAAARFHVDQQVDIASAASLAPSNRPEDTQVRGAVPRRRRQDLRTP